MLMFDSLNRHMLPPYGCDWTKAPNFERLAARTVTFDHSYVGSMPCMPTRRDMHTGRLNLLHRSWGPLEPFDDSVPKMLKQNGVTSHLLSDHYHYWEAGGATYHTQYSTWEFFRGQEGDPWKGQLADADAAGHAGRNAEPGSWHRQDRINRGFMTKEEQQPQSKTFQAGLEFLDRNHDQDNWFLHIETFDPHEPFFTQEHYKELYPEHHQSYDGPVSDWPPYSRVTESRELGEHWRHEYAALLSMCDAKLGSLLDAFDEHDLWDDTMLVVWTDHGFLLGEHDWWAKCRMPWYEELAHTPFFAWDPRSGKAGERRQALVQPSVDLGPTLLEFFGLELTKDMTGKPLRDAIASDAPVRQACIFGQHGAHVNVTDGRYVYMRAPAGDDNRPLYNYTLMPTNMRDFFALDKLREAELAPPFEFTKGCPLVKVDMGGSKGWLDESQCQTLLWDLEADPRQTGEPLADAAVEARMKDLLIACMQELDAPAEQFERLGLDG